MSGAVRPADLTARQVISIVRTSGVGELVDDWGQRSPSLSATGVERKLVEQRTGWTVVFGPVYASDIAAYLANRKKTEAMRQVHFPLSERLEMAAVWALPVSLLGAGQRYIPYRHLAASEHGNREGRRRPYCAGEQHR